jgi:hypothetical protein
MATKEQKIETHAIKRTANKVVMVGPGQLYVCMCHYRSANRRNRQMKPMPISSFYRLHVTQGKCKYLLPSGKDAKKIALQAQEEVDPDPRHGNEIQPRFPPQLMYARVRVMAGPDPYKGSAAANSGENSSDENSSDENSSDDAEADEEEAKELVADVDDVDGDGGHEDGEGEGEGDDAVAIVAAAAGSAATTKNKKGNITELMPAPTVTEHPGAPEKPDAQIMARAKAKTQTNPTSPTSPDVTEEVAAKVVVAGQEADEEEAKELVADVDRAATKTAPAKKRKPKKLGPTVATRQSLRITRRSRRICP